MTETTKIRVWDVDPDDYEEAEIRNDYFLVCDGNTYLDGVVAHANGTTVLTIKKMQP